MKHVLTACVLGGLVFRAAAADAYLESTGVQYVNTGYKVNPNTRLVADFAYTSATPVQQRVFGAASDATTPLLSCASYINGAGCYAWAFQNGSGNWTTTGIPATTDRRVLTLDGPNNRITLAPGATAGSVYSASLGTTRTATSLWPLALFANMNSADASDVNLFGGVRLYSFRIYESNRLVKCFLPYASGVTTGLLEVVSQQVYTDGAGKTPFRAGGDICDNPLPEDMRRNGSGDLEFRVRIAYSDMTVTAGGEPYTEDLWVAQNATLALVATPVAGTAFGGWTGDTAYITAGTAADASVTLTVSGPVTLAAAVARTVYHGVQAKGMENPASWKVQNGSAWVTPASVDYTTGQAFFYIKSTSATGNTDYLSDTLPANTVFKVYGIIWNRNWGSFEIKSSTGSVLDIGAGGMSVGNKYTDREYIVSAPVTLSADQTWNISPAAATYLMINNSVSGEGVTLTLAGAASKRIGTASTAQTYNWKRTVIKEGEFYLRNRANLLPDGHELVFGGTTAAAPATLNLSTFDQTLANALWIEEPGTCANNVLASGGAASKNNVVFTGTPRQNPTGFGGVLKEGAGVTWNPASADHVFVFSNGVSSTQGRLKVLNGTMRVEKGASFTALAEVNVGATGVFEVAADAGSVSGTALVLASGASVKLAAGVQVLFDTATCAGASLAGGVYTKDNAAWITGEGSLVVTGNSWTGGGGSDTAIDTWANWGGVEQNLTGGNLTGVFATGGTLCTVPAALSPVFRALIFQGSRNFTLAAEEGARVTVRAQGIQTAGASAARTFAITAPLALDGDQYWAVGGSDKLVVSNTVSGASVLNKDGAGELHLWGANTFTGVLNILNGRVWAHADDAFGSTAGRTVLTQNKGYVTLDGVTVHEGFLYTKGFSAFEVPAGKTSHVYGLLDNANGGNWGLNVSGALHIHGGAWGSGNFSFNNLHVDDVPLHLTDRLSASGSIWLNVSSNWVGNNHTLMGNGCRIYCRAPYAYYRGPRNEAGYSSFGKTTTATYITRIQFSSTGIGIFDLGGYDQETCQLLCSQANSAKSCVTSSVPAQLHIYRDRNDNCSATDTMALNYVKFQGGAGCTIDRFGNYAMSFLSESTTTGRLVVAEGTAPTAAASTLTLGTSAGAGGWPHASEVRVTGGKLVFTHDGCVGRRTDVYVDATHGTLQLDNAQVQECRDLYFYEGGAWQRQRIGRTYGSSASAAAVKVASGLAGTGLLRPHGRPACTMIIR